jgi:hypothetical protein
VNCRFEKILQADPPEHFGADPISDANDDLGSIL